MRLRPQRAAAAGGAQPRAHGLAGAGGGDAARSHHAPARRAAASTLPPRGPQRRRSAPGRTRTPLLRPARCFCRRPPCKPQSGWLVPACLEGERRGVARSCACTWWCRRGSWHGGSPGDLRQLAALVARDMAVAAAAASMRRRGRGRRCRGARCRVRRWSQHSPPRRRGGAAWRAAAEAAAAGEPRWRHRPAASGAAAALRLDGLIGVSVAPAPAGGAGNGCLAGFDSVGRLRRGRARARARPAALPAPGPLAAGGRHCRRGRPWCGVALEVQQSSCVSMRCWTAPATPDGASASGQSGEAAAPAMATQASLARAQAPGVVRLPPQNPKTPELIINHLREGGLSSFVLSMRNFIASSTSVHFLATANRS